MKRSLVFAIYLILGAGIACASICPTTVNTNSDCGYILTIHPGDVVTGASVTGASPYDGNDDALIGVINDSGAAFTGTIALSGSGNGGGAFGFDGDGICTFIGPGGSGPTSMGSYCSSAQVRGSDPGDYEGPLNTFSNINSDGSIGDVDIAGLAAGGTTFFSLEGSPASLTLTPAGATPEPGSLALLGTGVLAGAVALRRRLAL